MLYFPFSFGPTRRMINDNSLLPHRTQSSPFLCDAPPHRTALHTNNKSFRGYGHGQSSLLQSTPPTRPHHRAGPRQPPHRLKQPPGDLDCGRPSGTPAGSYSHRTVPNFVSSRASPASPALGSSMRVCFSTAQLFSPSSPSGLPAVCLIELLGSLVLSRAVSSPQLLCTLTPIWSCHSMLTPPRPPIRLLACLRAV